MACIRERGLTFFQPLSGTFNRLLLDLGNVVGHGVSFL
jgi:hypothetical protein